MLHPAVTGCNGCTPCLGAVRPPLKELYILGPKAVLQPCLHTCHHEWMHALPSGLAPCTCAPSTFDMCEEVWAPRTLYCTSWQCLRVSTGKHEAADHLHPQPLTTAQLRTAQVLCYLPVNSHFPCPGIPPGPSQQGARVQILHFQVGPASGWPAHRPRPSSATATRWQHTAMDAVHPEPVCIARLRQQETIPHLLLQ
jgi:hypothetical protein